MGEDLTHAKLVQSAMVYPIRGAQSIEINPHAAVKQKLEWGKHMING